MATKKVTTETKKTETVTKPAAAKAEPAKTPAAKTTTEEKAPAKAAARTTAAKTTAAKTVAAKTTTKKTTTKKTTAKKEMKVNAVVEYYGQQMDEKTIIANVKKAWTKSGRKVGDIKTMDLYIKPEESAVYYVINGIDTGAVALF
nr:DUF6465 family protein [uncultured Merdimonas sp.]